MLAEVVTLGKCQEAGSRKLHVNKKAFKETIKRHIRLHITRLSLWHLHTSRDENAYQSPFVLIVMNL